MLTSVVSVYFYLRIVVMMYMSERDARPVPPPISGVAMAGLVVSVAAVLWLGVLPAPVIAWAEVDSDDLLEDFSMSWPGQRPERGAATGASVYNR